MVNLKLELDDVNFIMTVLSERPFGEVYKLINNIHSQTKESIEDEQKNTTEGV